MNSISGMRARSVPKADNDRRQTGQLVTRRKGLRGPLAAAPPKDDEEWAERCAYWAEQVDTPVSRPSQKRAERPPLVLSGHGVRLHVENGALIIQNGFTHYPQQREVWRFFSGEWRVPSRIIVLDAKGGLTFHALRWLAERDIPLVHIDWQGNVVHVVGGSGYAIDRKLAEVQFAAVKNGSGLELSRRLITKKIENSMETLRTALPSSPATERALQRLRRDADQMRRCPPSSVSELLGIEGRVAFAYFTAWHSFPIRWNGTGRRPIPEDWRRIGRRSSSVGKRSNPNHRATHPVNAMLNYAYAVLETRVRAQIISAGLDPTIGFFHGSYPADKTALVYDLMEPLRPLVDRSLLEFLQRNTFAPGDFVFTRQGICRLNSELAKAVVRISSAPEEFDRQVDAIPRELLRWLKTEM